MDAKKLQTLHRAATMIEVDGIDAIKAATRLVGEEVATALVIAHIRRGLGSMDRYPARAGIETETNEILRQHPRLP